MKCIQPGIKKLIVYSDGAASQFKNRFLLKYLEVIRRNYSSETLEWQFFATSHGKGVVDSIGGTVKSIVRRQMLSEVVENTSKASIKNASSFIERVQQSTVVDLSEYTEADVKAIEETFSKYKIDDAPAIPRLKSQHCKIE